MLELIFILPFVFGIVSFVMPQILARWMLLILAVLHPLFTAMIWFKRLEPLWSSYFYLTPEGALALTITSFIFLCVSIYTVFYMSQAAIQNETIFCACMMLLLGSMSMVAVTDHIIVMWIAIEATTLMSAPLIFLHRSKKALEATWKYVLICSVGIALALLGVFFTLISIKTASLSASMTFANLFDNATGVDITWLKAGFILTMVGYGTKMELAPMHTWLPDVNSEAPSPVSALLSGALSNCAFLGIFKTHLLMEKVGLGWYSGNALAIFGLISILLAAIFIMQQDNYKRLLAYSSIENMGIIAFGIGIGGIAAYGAMLHLVHHALLKSSLFLSAGNILLGYKTKKIKETGKMPSLMPKTFFAFMAGFVGISGFPPFGIFVSEFFIIMGALQQKAYTLAAIFIFGLILVFAGASKAIIRISFGNCASKAPVKEKWWLALPSYALIAASLFLAIYMPDALSLAIEQAVSAIGGRVDG